MGERYGLFFEEFPADYPEKSRALLTGFALSGIQGYLFGRINGEWTPAVGAAGLPLCIPGARRRWGSTWSGHGGLPPPSH